MSDAASHFCFAMSSAETAPPPPTVTAEDEALLEGGAGGLSPQARLAVQLRLQLKRARDLASS